MVLKLTVDGAALDREPSEVRLPCASEAEFFALTEGIEGRVCELADGEASILSPVKRRHDAVTGLLCTLLRLFVERRALGRVHGQPYSMRLAEGLIREPDAFFVTADRARLLGDLYLDGPADLVIEVVSDTRAGRHRDLVEKRDDYEAHGVREYWAVDPGRGALRAHVLGDDGRYALVEHRAGRVESVACPGFFLECAWVLEEPVADDWACLAALLGPDLGGAGR